MLHGCIKIWGSRGSSMDLIRFLARALSHVLPSRNPNALHEPPTGPEPYKPYLGP